MTASFLRRYNSQLILVSVVGASLLAPFAPGVFTNLHFLGDLFINLLNLCRYLIKY